jgi:hypothetical protein
MNKLIHDPTSHGQKVIFSTAQELESWLAKQPRGILFAVGKHSCIVYAVESPSEGEHLWRLTTTNESFYMKFNELVDDYKYSLYYIDDHQMVGLIETCEN